MDKTTFIPVRGEESTILSMPKVNGHLYVTTDTRKIFLDYADRMTNELKRIPIGMGCAMIYGHKEISSNESNEDNVYFSLS